MYLITQSLYRPTSELDHSMGIALSEHYRNWKSDDFTASQWVDTLASYRAFKAELVSQYQALTIMGIKFEFTPNDPYETYKDLKYAFDNGHTIRVFSEGEPLPDNHPFNEVDDEIGVSYNLIFRAVHDILGHCWYGNEFTPIGEENAVRAHVSFCRPVAIPALVCETRAQNAAVAFGPHRDTFTVGDKIPVNLDGTLTFPEQKVIFIPAKFCKFN